jgi:demethylmenaquinone methyltransferase/2-methoxy-6-polyprenyl-1,4-benzoquinol methylase
MHTPVGTKVKSMFASIAHRYDVTNTILSLGIHHIWKRHFIRSLHVGEAPRVMDLACGTGDLVPLLKSRHGGTVTGVDFCEPMLEVARERFPQFEFLQGDALNLNFADNQFDLITVSFGVRNFENLEHGLKEIHRVLKPGGQIAVLEFGQPDGVLFGPFYRFYSRYIMPRIGGLLTGNQDAYEYLPETAAAFPCGEQFLEILKRVGFHNPKLTRYTFGIAYGYCGVKQ